MASLLLLCFSLFLTLSTSTASAAVNATIDNQSPLSLLTFTPPPQTHVQKPPQQLQLNTIIDSIVGAGDFNNWASMIAEVDPSIFPLTATLFIPDDAAFVTKTPPPSYPPPSTTAVNFADPLLFTYHILPRRYSYSELRRFPTGYRLPTLLPDNTLLITDNSAGNFTINGVAVTRPNLFQNAIVSVHGIGNILDHTQFGKTVPSPEKSPEMVNTPLPLLEVSTSAVNTVNIIKNICLVALLCLAFLGFLGVDLDIILVQALSACVLFAATVSRGFYIYMQDEFRFFLYFCLLCIVALISLLQSFHNWGFWP
ncbi:hypothetical protein BVRB_5g118310 [Beta vulgaris subsp. vulgaris]|nr:hypothetical protein BVRB_5g118310 [Beta vulgaris subsp. vulgaris]